MDIIDYTMAIDVIICNLAVLRFINFAFLCFNSVPSLLNTHLCRSILNQSCYNHPITTVCKIRNFTVFVSMKILLEPHNSIESEIVYSTLT